MYELNCSKRGYNLFFRGLDGNYRGWKVIPHGLDNISRGWRGSFRGWQLFRGSKGSFHRWATFLVDRKLFSKVKSDTI